LLQTNTSNKSFFTANSQAMCRAAQVLPAFASRRCRVAVPVYRHDAARVFIFIAGRNASGLEKISA